MRDIECFLSAGDDVQSSFLTQCDAEQQHRFLLRPGEKLPSHHSVCARQRKGHTSDQSDHSEAQTANGASCGYVIRLALRSLSPHTCTPTTTFSPALYGQSYEKPSVLRLAATIWFLSSGGGAYGSYTIRVLRCRNKGPCLAIRWHAIFPHWPLEVLQEKRA